MVTTSPKVAGQTMSSGLAQPSAHLRLLFALPPLRHSDTREYAVPRKLLVDTRQSMFTLLSAASADQACGKGFLIISRMLPFSPYT